MYDRGRVTLEVAAVVARLGKDELANLRRALALPEGVQELIRLLSAFYREEPDLRRALIAEIESDVGRPHLRISSGS